MIGTDSRIRLCQSYRRQMERRLKETSDYNEWKACHDWIDYYHQKEEMLRNEPRPFPFILFAAIAILFAASLFLFEPTYTGMAGFETTIPEEVSGLNMSYVINESGWIKSSDTTITCNETCNGTIFIPVEELPLNVSAESIETEWIDLEPENESVTINKSSTLTNKSDLTQEDNESKESSDITNTTADLTVNETQDTTDNETNTTQTNLTQENKTQTNLTQDITEANGSINQTKDLTGNQTANQTNTTGTNLTNKTDLTANETSTTGNATLTNDTESTKQNLTGNLTEGNITQNMTDQNNTKNIAEQNNTKASSQNSTPAKTVDKGNITSDNLTEYNGTDKTTGRDTSSRPLVWRGPKVFAITNTLELNLSEYMGKNVTYIASSDYQTTVSKGILKVTAGEKKESVVTIYARKGENITREEILIRKTKAIQKKAEAGKPVRWEKPVHEKLDIPSQAVNITLIHDGKQIRLDKADINRSEYPGDLNVTYSTPAPVKKEKKKGIKKEIIINSSFHYINVSASTEIDETVLKPRLYHYINGSRVDVTDKSSYNVTYHDTDDNGLYDLIRWVVPHLSAQRFETGLASVNTNKSRYHPGETANITIVVLDNEGYLSSADVSCTIESPSDNVTFQDIEEISKGIYSFEYKIPEEGEYGIEVRAISDKVNDTMHSSFLVEEDYPFEIIRDAPMTTDPWQGPFRASITINPYYNGTYTLKETIPPNLSIQSTTGTIENNTITLTASGETQLNYTLQPPLKTPDLYALNSRIEYADNTFYEARPWFIAIDPIVVDTNLSYYDDLSTNQSIAYSDKILFNATRKGGIELQKGCLDYMESGCWRHARELTLTGQSTGPYPFSFTLDTRALINEKKMNSDCSDLRITWQNDSEQQVYFWIEEGYCNRSQTTIWVSAPRIDDTETFRVYYANQDASQSSYHDGEQVFPFFDDFNDGSLDNTKWQTVTDGHYNFPEGEGYVEYWTDGGGWFNNQNNPSFASIDTFANGTLYWRMLTPDSDGDFDGAIGVREPDTDDVAEGTFFMLDSRDAENVGIVDMPGFDYISLFDNFLPQDLWVRSKGVFSGTYYSFYNDYHGYEITGYSDAYSDGYIEAWCDSDNDGANRAGLDWIMYLNRTQDTHGIEVSPEISDYENTGNLTTINIDSNASFTTFFADHHIPEGTNITYRLFNENTLCDIPVAEEITEYDISGCTFGNDNLSIEAVLTTTNTSFSPRVDEWAISWFNGDLLIDEPDYPYHDRFIDFYLNGSYSGSDEIAAQYKKIGGSGEMDDSYDEFRSYVESNDIGITDDLSLLPDTSTGTWYDQDWPHRLSFNVTGKSQVKIELDTTDLDFSATDFSDIRVTYLNNSAQKEEILPHWVQESDSNHAIIWTRIKEGTDSIFVYYGNPGAQDSSDGDEVFDFFEDFENTTLDNSKWIDNEGTYSITGGEFVGQPGTELEYIYTSEYTVDEPKIIEFAMRGNSDNWRAGIGIGSWNFIEHYETGAWFWTTEYDFVIDRNRWGNDLSDSGQARNNDALHNYMVKVDSGSTSFNDTTQGRGHSVTQTPTGPLYLVNDGNAETIIDWIFTRENTPVSIQKWKHENVSFSLYGNYTSDSLDTNASIVYYDTLEYESHEPADTNLTVYTRTSHDDSSWTGWEKQEDSNQITSDGRRYLQYLVEMETLNTTITPVLDSISINYKTSLAMFFTNMSESDTVFAASNPYSCSGGCSPEWQVTPKKQGKFVLRLAGESVSNEKIIYVFADTLLDTISDPVAAPGDEIRVSGTLTDDLGKDVSGKILIFIDDSKIGSAIADEGSYSANIKVPEFPIGNHTLKTVFRKDYERYFNPSEDENNLLISSRPNITNISINDAGIGNPIDLVVSANDTRGIDYLETKVTRPDGTQESFIFNDSLEYKNTWDVGTYTFDVIVTNIDGIQTQSTVYADIQGTATVSPHLNKDSYQNHEDVYVSDSYYGWNKKLPITTNATNRTVIFDIDKSEVWSYTNGSDIAFYGKEELAHWVKNTSIYVRLKNQSEITMYYDGPVSRENKSGVFDFYDDVSEDKESEYTEEVIYDRGANNGLFTWDTAQNRITIDNSNDDMIAYPSIAPSEFEAEVTVHGGDDDALGLFVQSGSTYYEALISNDFPNAGTDGIFSQTQGNTPALLQATSEDIDSQSTQTIRLRYESDTLSMYVDDSLQATYDIDLEPSAIGFISVAMDGEDYLTNFSLRELHDTQVEYGDVQAASKAFNTGDRPINGYRWANIQYYNGLYWENLYPAPINDIATADMKTISNGTTLDYYYDWNNNPWNTGIFPHGKYRVKFSLVRNTTNPDRDDQMIVDSDYDKIVGYDTFHILQAYLYLANLTHENKIDEYETTDTIDWMNITLFAKNNTAFDSEVTLTLLDRYGVDYVGFGPDHETKHYGEIPYNTTKTRQWNEGYTIPEDAQGSYMLKWDVMMDLLNGPLKVNRTQYILVHNLRDSFTRTNITRQYQESSQLMNVSVQNKWSQNLTGIDIYLNCPDIENLTCACLEGCSLPTLEGDHTSVFNITAGDAQVGDYDLNVTISYTNPGGEHKFWDEIMNQKLEIREAGLFEITEHSSPPEVTRGTQADISYFAQSSNNSDIIDAYLDISSYPDWTPLTSLSAYTSLLSAGDLLWNNVTFDVPLEAEIGEQIILAESQGSGVKSDFKNVYIDVFAGTSLDLSISDNDTSRDEQVTARARLLYDNGTAISNQQVYFFDETDNIPVGSATTDTDGWAEKSFTPDSAFSLGMHTINVTYDGSGYKRSSAAKETMKLGLKPTIQEVIIEPVLGYGMNQTIRANITDDTGIENAWAWVTYPNGSQQQVNLQEDTYFTGNFDDTWFNGTYNVQVFANDTSGSINHSQAHTFSVSTDGGIRINVNRSAYDLYENVTLKKTIPWWDDDFQKRKEIIIDQDIEGYTFDMDMDTRSMLPSGDDLRIVWFNGSNNEIDRINMTPFDSSSTQIRFRLQGNGTYYIYYSNPSASTAPSNLSEIYYFYDDFNRPDSAEIGNGWIEWGSDANIVDGRLEVQGSSGVKHDISSLSEDFDISFSMDIPSSGDGWWQHIGVGDGSTMIDSDDTTGLGPAIYTRRETGFLGLTESFFITSFPSTDAIIEEDVSGLHQYDLHVDNQYDYLRDGTHSVGNIDWVNPEATLDQLRIYSDGAPAHYYDNIIITLSSSNPPSYSIGEEETFTEDSLTTTRPFKGDLIAEIQRYDDTWQTIDTHISTGQSIDPGIFDLEEIWTPWNTANNQGGTYRVHAYMQTPYGDPIYTEDGIYEGSDEFTILAPQTYVTIEDMRIYEINTTTRYSGGTLVDSGLSKKFTMFANESYRVELELKNNYDSQEWNISETIFSHAGLNSTWDLNESEIWYVIGYSSRQFNGTWNGTVLWNTTGTVPVDTKLTLSYIVTPGTGDYPVTFTLDDPLFTKSDESTYHVIRRQSEHPKLYDSTYGLTGNEVIRTQSTAIFARWDQEIAEAEVYYNATIPGIISDTITLPEGNSHNWTNHTFTTSNWYLGKHSARIEARNPSGYWNRSLDFLDFTVFGLAKTDMVMNATEIDLNDSVMITCTITDDTNSSFISDYPVSIYSGNNLLFEGTTVEGQVNYSYQPPSYGLYDITCNISEHGLYKVDSRNTSSQTLFVREFEPPRYEQISGPMKTYKGNKETYSVHWTDNAELFDAFLAMDITGTYHNVTNISLASNDTYADIEYTIPVSAVPGNHSWIQYARDTSLNVNVTPSQPFELWGYSGITEISQVGSSVRIGNYTTTFCQVQDLNTTTGISGYNVSFYREGSLLGYNLTNATGWAAYSFNDSELGLHTVSCNITDQMNYNASLFANTTLNVVNTSDIYPPSLEVYGINDTTISRGQCIRIYGRWDEEPNTARAVYNISDFVREDIPAPYTGNWTNLTVCTNNSWTIGKHAIKLWANDSNKNINNTVPYLYFNLTGNSRVDWVSPSGITPRGMTNLTCSVTDADNGEPISSYLVQYYGPEGYIGSSYSGSDGQASYEIDLTNTSIGSYDYQCNIQSTDLYRQMKSQASDTIEIVNYLPIELHHPFDKQRIESRNIDFNWTPYSDVQGEPISCNLSINGTYHSTVLTESGSLTSKVIENVSYGTHNWSVSCWGQEIHNTSDFNRFTVGLHENIPPEIPVRITPQKDNLTLFDRRPVFSWEEAFDANGDDLSYNLHVELLECSGPLQCSVHEINQTNITSLNFTPSSDLDYDSIYSWRIQAYDGIAHSNWSEPWNFSIESRIIVSLSNENVSFGVQRVGDSTDTTDDSNSSTPQPFIVRNDGNIIINIHNISAQDDLWESPVGKNPSRFFQIKADNSTEYGSFDYNQSVTEWANVSSNAYMIRQLLHHDYSDEAEIEVRIEVPWEETPGKKQSTLIFYGEPGE
ncbi:MAG: DUF2341 domain-containing protein [Candidatus Woesearchaeota archaeon]